MQAAVTILRASLDDVERIVAQRRAMFVDMGHPDDAVMHRMVAEFRPWLIARMESAQYLAWFAAAAGGAIVGGAGLWLMDWPPHLIGSGAVRGNVVNVYTQREYRRQGIARALVGAAMSWCGENGVSCVILHASAEGRALYESLGFRPTNEMRRLL